MTSSSIVHFNCPNNNNCKINYYYSPIHHQMKWIHCCTIIVGIALLIHPHHHHQPTTNQGRVTLIKSQSLSFTLSTAATAVEILGSHSNHHPPSKAQPTNHPTTLWSQQLKHPPPLLPNLDGNTQSYCVLELSLTHS